MRQHPSALESERQVIASALIAPDTLDVAMDLLDPGDFYSEAHQRIWRTIVTLSQRKQAVDGISVRETLMQAGELAAAGGDDYLLGLTDSIPTVANVETHAKIIRGRARRRRFISVATEKVAAAYGPIEGDDEEFLTHAEASILDACRSREADFGLVPVSTMAVDLLKHLQACARAGGGPTGVTTGIDALDGMLSGLHPGTLTVIAARPGMGKTALALRAAEVNALKGVGTAFFSLEMSKEQLMMRLLSSRADVPVAKIRTAQGITKDEWSRMTREVGELHRWPLHVDETSALDLLKLRARLRRLLAEHPEIGLVVVDYLQLMRSGRRIEPREAEIAEVSRDLKAISKDFRIPVVALAQLNRGVESRGDKRPSLGDLRESGQIEQDADAVVFIYRDELYNEKSVHRGVAELIVGKNRMGATGSVKCAFVARRTRFENLETRNEFQDDFPSGKDAAGGWD